MVYYELTAAPASAAIWWAQHQAIEQPVFDIVVDNAQRCWCAYEKIQILIWLKNIFCFINSLLLLFSCVRSRQTVIDQ